MGVGVQSANFTWIFIFLQIFLKILYDNEIILSQRGLKQTPEPPCTKRSSWNPGEFKHMES